MKTKHLFDLCDEDKELFANMKGKYISEEEKIFFETMCCKELDEPTYSHELLILEDENEDAVFIVRIDENEYDIGGGHITPRPSVYAHSLAEALLTNLADIGVTSMQGTLLDWLRARNYKGIRYDRNLDLM